MAFLQRRASFDNRLLQRESGGYPVRADVCCLTEAPRTRVTTASSSYKTDCTRPAADTGYAWCIVAAALVVLIELFGVNNLGALLGVFFTGTGIAALLAPTLAGALVDYSGRYEWGIAFALLIGAVGFIVILPLRDHQATKLTAS